MFDKEIDLKEKMGYLMVIIIILGNVYLTSLENPKADALSRLISIFVFLYALIQLIREVILKEDVSFIKRFGYMILIFIGLGTLIFAIWNSLQTIRIIL